MTHISNYGNDRLALFLFEHAINFVQQYTNLWLITEPPLKLAEVYFNLFPNEKMPLWTVSMVVLVVVSTFLLHKVISTVAGKFGGGKVW